MKRIVAIFVLLSSGTHLVALEPHQILQEAELHQLQIRASAGQLAAQLDEVLAEFDANGLGDCEDARLLGAVKAVLGEVTEAEMLQVVELLRTARESTDDGAMRSVASRAYEAQHGVVLRLRTLISEHQKRQAMFDLVTRIRRLIARQESLLEATSIIARHQKLSAGKKLPEASLQALRVHSSEQELFNTDVLDVVEAIELLGAGAVGDAAVRLKIAVELSKSAGLIELLESIVVDLRAGEILRAAGGQTVVRKTLIQLAEKLTVEPVATTQPSTAEQADLQARVEKLMTELRKLREQQSALGTTPGDAQAQMKLADEARQLAKKLQSTHSDAAMEAARAASEMHDAAKAMNINQPRQARSSQEAATAALQRAEESLADQLRKLEQAQTELRKLQETRNAVGEMLKRRQQISQRTAKSDSSSDRENALRELAAQEAQLAADAESQSAQLSPETGADQLQDAAASMKQAAAALSNRDSPSARSHQGESLESLDRAKGAIDSEIAELKRQLGELAEAASDPEMDRRIQQAQQSLSDAEQKLERGQDAQDQIESASEDASEALSKSSSTDSSDSIREALEQMNQAASQAAQGKAPEARRSAQQARETLDSAMSESQAAAKGSKQGDKSGKAKGAKQAAEDNQQAQTDQDPGGSGNSAAQRGGDDTGGSRNDVRSTGKFQDLPARDRKALEQSQSAGFPAEYAPLIEQYLKNLAEGGSK